MKKPALLLALMLGSTALPTAAEAAPVIKTYNFTLSDFVDVVGNTAAPITSLTGSFTINFDPALSYNSQTAGITINSLSTNVFGSPISFSAGPGTPYFMSIGGTATGAGLITSGLQDFVLQLRFPNASSLDSPELPVCGDGFSCGSASGTVLASGYTLAGVSGGWLARTGSVVSVTAVPEPASWAMMIAGFGLAGAAMRRRRTLAIASA